MKKKYSLVTIIGVFTLFLFSCEKEIDLEHLRPTPKLVLNSIAETGTPLTASLSRTWFYTDNNPNVAIGDAAVNLYVNDRFVETMAYKKVSDFDEDEIGYGYGYAYNSLGLYITSYVPTEGDHIRIAAEREGFESVEAEVSVMKSVPITDFKITQIKWVEYGNEYTREQMEVTFTDVPGETNYYLINFERGVPYIVGDREEELQRYYFWSSFFVDYATDPLFTSHLTAMDEIMGYDWISGRYGRVFNDDLIRDKEYTIKVQSHTFSYYSNYPEEDNIVEAENLPDSVRVNLYAIPEPYYRYIKSIIEMYDDTMSDELSSSGLAEPVRVYSNVKGGTGILGSSNPYSATIAVPSQ